jgi:hypothetical protein
MRVVIVTPFSSALAIYQGNPWTEHEVFVVADVKE